ncbi:MAG: hypothetical protein MJE12_13260 [Alphaproteobacteria bacterium]|nr:hypothetical protein [Alphaproteobacteria bacterium]
MGRRVHCQDRRPPYILVVSPSPYAGSTGFLRRKVVGEKPYLSKKGVGRGILFGAVLQRT